MKKVGIFTLSWYWLSSNYGTFFQHWALRQTLKQMGYSPFRVTRNETPHTIVSFLKASLRALIAIPWHVLRWNKPLKEELLQWTYRTRSTFKFQCDYKKLINATNESNLAHIADIFVGGSDQMWSTNFFKCITHIPTLTYAASTDWLTASKNQELIRLMDEKQNFLKSISIREKAGIEWLKQINYHTKNLFHAIDPVFHWTKDDYLALTSPKKVFKKPTLLCYFVNIRAKEEFSLSFWEDVAQKLNVNLKIIGIQGLENYLPFSKSLIPSPRDFLRCYRDADYVVTNSFHGTVFSLIMNKPFACLKQRELPGASQNVRCDELLSWLKLTDSYLPYDASQEKVVSTLKSLPDYTTINTIIEQRRAESKQWLEKALALCQE